MTDVPFDAGLQPERTLLAWRRTCLSVGGASLLAIRFALHELGFVAIALGLMGIALAGLAYLGCARRYRRVHAHLASGRDLPSASVPVLLTAASIVVLAISSGVWLVARDGAGIH